MYITHLPDELITYGIVPYLPINELLTIRRVNTTWRQLNISQLLQYRSWQDWTVAARMLVATGQLNQLQLLLACRRFNPNRGQLVQLAAKSGYSAILDCLIADPRVDYDRAQIIQLLLTSVSDCQLRLALDRYSSTRQLLDDDDFDPRLCIIRQLAESAPVLTVLLEQLPISNISEAQVLVNKALKYYAIATLKCLGQALAGWSDDCLGDISYQSHATHPDVPASIRRLLPEGITGDRRVLAKLIQTGHPERYTYLSNVLYITGTDSWLANIASSQDDYLMFAAVTRAWWGFRDVSIPLADDACRSIISYCLELPSYLTGKAPNLAMVEYMLTRPAVFDRRLSQHTLRQMLQYNYPALNPTLNMLLRWSIPADAELDQLVQQHITGTDKLLIWYAGHQDPRAVELAASLTVQQLFEWRLPNLGWIVQQLPVERRRQCLKLAIARERDQIITQQAGLLTPDMVSADRVGCLPRLARSNWPVAALGEIVNQTIRVDRLDLLVDMVARDIPVSQSHLYLARQLNRMDVVRYLEWLLSG